MNKNGAAKKIDFIFLSLVLYIILFIIYYYFLRKSLFCIGLSFLTLISIYLIYFGVTKNKRAKRSLSLKEKKHCENIFFNLPFLCREKIDEFLKKLFNKAGYNIKADGILTAEKDEITRNIYCRFDKKADITDIYECEKQRQQTDCQGFILLCNEIDSQALNTIKNINGNSIVLECKAFYEIMKKFNEFPQTPYQIKQNNKSAAKFFVYMFKRERFKSYFLLAVIMFLFSFVSPFKNYYLIFSAIVFVLSCITLLKKQRVASNKNDII